MAITGTGRPAPRGSSRRRISNAMWGGSRFYTNRAIEHVDWGTYPRKSRITSRKRLVSLGNLRSDHFFRNVRADAVDFAEPNAVYLATKVAKRMGWKGVGLVPDYTTWTTWHNGRKYEHQIIWGTHGTGPHLHYGVHRL